MSKPGFIYYKNDTNRYQDIKIKRLKKDFKGIGVSVHDYILNEIYRDKGYFIKWDDNLAFDVAEYWGISEDDVHKIVAGCCHIGLFNDAKFQVYRIITSRAIQVRYIEWSKQAKRSGAFIQEEYQVFPEEMINIPEKTSTTQNVQEEIDIVEYSIIEESKEEQSKVAKPIVDSLPASAEAEPAEPKISKNKWIETFDDRKAAFKESLYPFTNAPPKYNGSYTADMVAAFFKCWSEPNKSRSKMRWETEKTWDLNLRLSNWANRETNFKQNTKTGNVHQTTIPASNTGFRVQGRK